MLCCVILRIILLIIKRSCDWFAAMKVHTDKKHVSTFKPSAIVKVLFCGFFKEIFQSLFCHFSPSIKRVFFPTRNKKPGGESPVCIVICNAIIYQWMINARNLFSNFYVVWLALKSPARRIIWSSSITKWLQSSHFLQLSRHPLRWRSTFFPINGFALFYKLQFLSLLAAPECRTCYFSGFYVRTFCTRTQQLITTLCSTELWWWCRWWHGLTKHSASTLQEIVFREMIAVYGWFFRTPTQIIAATVPWF